MTPSVTLVDLTADNWEEVSELEVSAAQRDHVASNLFSIAQSRFLPGFRTAAIVHNGANVGFTLYGLDPDDGHFWLYRLMVDQRHQGAGLGRAAIGEIVAQARAEWSAPVVRLSVVPDNAAAIGLYRSCGFVSTGQLCDGEAVMELKING